MKGIIEKEKNLLETEKINLKAPGRYKPQQERKSEVHFSCLEEE